MDTQIDANVNNIVIKRQIQIEAFSKAVYLVTDLFSENEPLRNSLRKLAVDLISIIDKGQASKVLSRIDSLLRLSKDLELISEMNAQILFAAVLNIQNTLTQKDNVDMSSISKTITEDSYEKDSVKDSRPISEASTFPYVATSSNERLASTAQITQQVPMTHKHEKEVVVTRERSTAVPMPGLDIGSRRKKILEIVKTKGQVTINEFIDEIQGCSSKTIQRELTSLVLSGTLKKSGERRWSRYSLK